jgi:hypothetical protein
MIRDGKRASRAAGDSAKSPKPYLASANPAGNNKHRKPSRQEPT